METQVRVETAPTGGSIRATLYPFAITAIGSLLVGIVGWSRWWHHSDMRQTWANAATFLLFVVLGLTMTRGYSHVGTRRWVASVALALPLGAAVFVLVARSTATACGTCPWL